MARKTFYSAVLLGATLSACGPVNRGLESVNQPVVSRTDYVLNLQGGYGGLAEGETARLDDWFRSLDLRYGDIIYVDGTDPAQRAAIGSVAERYGLLVSPGVPVTTGAVAEGTTRVVLSRTSADVPNCPNWSYSRSPQAGHGTSANFGCAVNGNLAAMVANPEDLVRGREAGAGSDARTATKALKTYRDATPTGSGGLKSESSKGGN